MDFTSEYSTKELSEYAESQYQILRLSSTNERDFNQKVSKVKKDLRDFLRSEHSVLMEPEDLEAVKHATRTIRAMGLFIMTPSFLLSMYLKSFKLFRNISKGPDIAIRIFLLFGSTGGIYSYSYTQNKRLSAIFELKYAFRVQKFNITKDPRAINPNYIPS